MRNDQRRQTFDLRLIATSKECTPNGLDNKKVDDDDKAIEEKKEDNWIVKKCVPIDCFCVKCINKEEKKERRNNDRHELLQCNDEDERHGEEKEPESVEVNKRKNEKGNKRNKLEKKEINDMEMFALELNLTRTIENDVNMKQMKESVKASYEGK